MVLTQVFFKCASIASFLAPLSYFAVTFQYPITLHAKVNRDIRIRREDTHCITHHLNILSLSLHFRLIGRIEDSLLLLLLPRVGASIIQTLTTAKLIVLGNYQKKLNEECMLGLLRGRLGPVGLRT